MAELRFDKLPAFNWSPEINIGDRLEKQEKQNLQNQIPPRKPIFSSKETEIGRMHGSQRAMVENLPAQESPTKSEKGVLVLNACSKTLEESDFFRISPKGHHIEGWKSGLLEGILVTIEAHSNAHTSQLYPHETTKHSNL